MLALDCEMVGVGPQGVQSALARVVVVNGQGSVVYDSYVAPSERVTDYRTQWSGIRPEHLRDAPSFATVQGEVAALIKGHVLVGHGLRNDLGALMLSHPYKFTRDTARYRPLQRSKGRPHALRTLARSLLGVAIQGGDEGHDPAEDARAALLVYRHVRKEWEQRIQRARHGTGRRRGHAVNESLPRRR